MSVKLKILASIFILMALSAVEIGVFYSQKTQPLQNGHQAIEAAIAALALLIAAAGASYLLIKSIVPPLNKAIAFSDSLAVGYFETTVNASGKSETDALLRSMGALQDSLIDLNSRLENQIHETETAYFDMEKKSAALNEAHARLAAHDASKKAILDALDQGLFSFGPDGICSDVYSSACKALLGVAPAGMPVGDVLKLSSEEKDSVARVLELLFFDSENMANCEDVLSMLPDSFVNMDKARISLSYSAILGDDGKVQSVLAVATDHSAEDEALQIMHDREAEALRILRISGNRNLFTQFYHSISSFFADINESFSDVTPLESIRRDIHTFKGNASIFHLQAVVDMLHKIENQLVGVETAAAARQAVKPLLPSLQAILTQTHKQAYDILGKDFDQQGVIRIMPLKTLSTMVDRLRKLPNAEQVSQEFVEALMSEPIRNSLAAFDIEIQALSDRYGKKISPCYFTGDNFLIFTENYAPLFASLTHIARNIVGHAVDDPEERAARNKAPELTVIIETKKFKAGDQEWFRLSFEDDGCGIDVARLRQKLASTRSESAVAAMTDDQVMYCIFEDNLSTKDEVDKLSGRGVGLSAVKYEAEKLGGKVSVASQLGQFTTITIEVPFIWYTSRAE